MEADWGTVDCSNNIISYNNHFGLSRRGIILESFIENTIIFNNNILRIFFKDQRTSTKPHTEWERRSIICLEYLAMWSPPKRIKFGDL